MVYYSSSIVRGDALRPSLRKDRTHMNETLIWTLTSIGILAVVILLWVGYSLLRRWMLRRQHRYTAVKTGSMLRRFAGIRSYKVISGLQLQSGEETITVDQVLIGFFGIMLVMTQDEPGSIYGDYRDKQWMSVVTDKDMRDTKVTFDNPVLQLQKAHDAVRKLLAAHNLYKVQSEGYVVFGGKKVQLTNLGKDKRKGMPLLTLSQFKKLIHKEKYSANGPVVVEDIYHLLTGKKEK